MRRTVVVMSVVLLLVAATGCRVAKAGTRCRTTDWGHDSSHVLQCRKGRWVRVMTIGQAARAIAAVNAARAAQQAAATTTTTSPPMASPALPLASGASFQAVYALTSDQASSADPAMPAAIRHELGVVMTWFDSQTGGSHPRIVSSGGAVDVQTVTLGVTRAQVEASSNATYLVQQALAGVGLPGPNQRTVVYLDTGGDACGATAPAGTISVIFMDQCGIYPSSTSSWPNDGTYVAAHEMTHAFGAVDDCAPHATGDGHTGDDPRDVLYSDPTRQTPRDWNNIQLDPGHDDYYRTGRTDCYDIVNSPLWTS